MARRVAQALVLLFILLLGVLVLRRIMFLNKTGMPNAAQLEQISDDVSRAVGGKKIMPVKIVNKTAFLIVEREILDPSISAGSIASTVQKLHAEGWRDGKARNDREITLCKDQIVVDIDTSSSQVVNGPGYVGVSWGDVPVRCPSN